MKKLFCFLSMFLIIGYLNGIAFIMTAWGASYNNYEYELLDDETLEITGYTGNENNITIPNTIVGYKVSSIGDEAFCNCESLTSINISEGIVNIGSSAFSDCNNVTSIRIPNSVTTIDNSAFSNCSKLSNINIPKNVTCISNDTFNSCSSLSNINFPNNLKKIGGNAFSDCISLTNIDIPESVTSIGLNAFSNTKLINNQTTTVKYISDWAVAYEGEEKTVSIKSGTKGIADYLFRGEKNSVVCNDLVEKINIPDSVTIIGSSFGGCISLSSIEIPDSVRYIGSVAFIDCSSLSKISIPNGVTNIEYATFSGCSNLSEVKIPNSIKYIAADAFADCTSLSNIDIPSSIIEIGASAFENSAIINSQPTATKYVGNWLVACSSDEESVEIEPGTIGIADKTFYDCTYLKNISLPDSIKYIGYGAFKGTELMSNQSTVCYVEDWVVDYAGCDETTAEIKSGIIGIADGSFLGCDSLTSILIPESVINIPENAFYECNDKLVIKCYKNSAAHKYALQKNMDYEIIGKAKNSRLNKDISDSNKSKVILISSIATLTIVILVCGIIVIKKLKNK